MRDIEGFIRTEQQDMYVNGVRLCEDEVADITKNDVKGKCKNAKKWCKVEAAAAPRSAHFMS